MARYFFDPLTGPPSSDEAEEDNLSPSSNTFDGREAEAAETHNIARPTPSSVLVPLTPATDVNDEPAEETHNIAPPTSVLVPPAPATDINDEPSTSRGFKTSPLGYIYSSMPKILDSFSGIRRRSDWMKERPQAVNETELKAVGSSVTRRIYENTIRGTGKRKEDTQRTLRTPSSSLEVLDTGMVSTPWTHNPLYRHPLLDVPVATSIEDVASSISDDKSPGRSPHSSIEPASSHIPYSSPIDFSASIHTNDAISSHSTSSLSASNLSSHIHSTPMSEASSNVEELVGSSEDASTSSFLAKRKRPGDDQSDTNDTVSSSSEASTSHVKRQRQAESEIKTVNSELSAERPSDAFESLNTLANVAAELVVRRQSTSSDQTLGEVPTPSVSVRQDISLRMPHTSYLDFGSPPLPQASQSQHPTPEVHEYPKNFDGMDTNPDMGPNTNRQLLQMHSSVDSEDSSSAMTLWSNSYSLSSSNNVARNYETLAVQTSTHLTVTNIIQKSGSSISLKQDGLELVRNGVNIVQDLSSRTAMSLMNSRTHRALLADQTSSDDLAINNRGVMVRHFDGGLTHNVASMSSIGASDPQANDLSLVPTSEAGSALVKISDRAPDTSGEDDEDMYFDLAESPPETRDLEMYNEHSEYPEGQDFPNVPWNHVMSDMLTKLRAMLESEYQRLFSEFKSSSSKLIEESPDAQRLEEVVRQVLADQLPSLADAVKVDSVQLENAVRKALEEQLTSVMESLRERTPAAKTSDESADQRMKDVLKVTLEERIPSLLQEQLPPLVNAALNNSIPLAVRTAIDAQQTRGAGDASLNEKLAEVMKSAAVDSAQLKTLVETAVTEQLSLFAQSTVKNAVKDAVVDAIKEMNVSTEDGEEFDLDVSPNKTSRKNRKKESLWENGISGGRKKEEPRDNFLNDAFRDYLRSKGLLPSKGEPLPLSVPDDVLEAFEKDNIGGPNIDIIKLDWLSSLSESRWNKEAIVLLTKDFQQKLKDGEDYKAVEFNKETMTIKKLEIKCRKKLYRIREEVKNASKTNTVTVSGLSHFELWERRKYSRRRGTLHRRQQIIKRCTALDPPLWNSIDKVLKRLDIECVSSDESDIGEVESSRSLDQRRLRMPKQLRRIRLPWLNQDLSKLFQNVETYEVLVPPGASKDRRGNHSLPRVFDAVSVSSRVAEQKLPRNWYDNDWYMTRSEATKILLEATEEEPIPEVVPYAGRPSSSRPQPPAR